MVGGGVNKKTTRQLDVDCYAGIEIVTYAAGKSPPHLLQFAVNIVPPSKGMVSNN